MIRFDDLKRIEADPVRFYNSISKESQTLIANFSRDIIMDYVNRSVVKILRDVDYVAPTTALRLELMRATEKSHIRDVNSQLAKLNGDVFNHKYMTFTDEFVQQLKVFSVTHNAKNMRTLDDTVMFSDEAYIAIFEARQHPNCSYTHNSTGFDIKILSDGFTKPTQRIDELKTVIKEMIGDMCNTPYPFNSEIFSQYSHFISELTVSRPQINKPAKPGVYDIKGCTVKMCYAVETGNYYTDVTIHYVMTEEF